MDPKNVEQNTRRLRRPAFEVATEDYVRVTGTIEDKYEGENAFGAKLTVPAVGGEA